MARSGPDGWQLLAGSEWVSRGPFGNIKPSDASAAAADGPDAGRVRLKAARNGYVSTRLCVAGRGRYELAVEMDGPVEVDLFRCWYHRMAGPRYFADALIPVAMPFAARLPDVGNAVDGQSHQDFWLDLFVPADAATGLHEGRAVLRAGDACVELTIALDVIEAVIPDESAITCDHNSYGCRWIERMYPNAFGACHGESSRMDLTIRILHDYYRLCHEHRGLFSNLGAEHSGHFDPIYGPTASGRGREKNLSDWTLFDKHYGPLLDGSAFASAAAGAPRPRRPASPVGAVYTPINAAWPANYLWWGQPGYEVEFMRCLRQFDRHFRDNGWLTTRLSFFFNHKKRYRWFAWDGDEVKHAKDNRYLLEMGRLLRKAVGDSPVPWSYRMDASWQMKNQFEIFRGVVDLWVCNSFLRWYPDETRRVLARCENVWTYSGTPAIDETSSALLEHVLTAWGRGLHGHCRWLTSSPGDDPWFDCDGAATGMLYPGDRFGIAGPIPSTRLKIQRNAVQDVSLLSARCGSAERLETLRADLADAAGLDLWEDPPPVVTDQPPEVWDGTNLPGPDENMNAHVARGPLWWAPIRDAALSEEAE